MDNLDEILNAEPEPEEDEALDFIIDEDMRVIAVPDKGVVLGVEGDKDVNRIRFRMNRYYRGTDLADFDIRVKYRNPEDERNYFVVSDKTVTDSTITFVWVVAADATACKGTVWFAVSFFTAKEDGVIGQCFNTTLGQAKSLEGLDVDAEADDPELVDFMTHLKNDLTVHVGELLTQAENAKDAAARSEQNAKASEEKALASRNAAETSEKNTSAMLNKLTVEYTGGCLGSYAVTLPVSGWTKQSGAAAYSCTATLAESTVACIPVSAVQMEDIPAAREAVLYGSCESLAGQVRFWADNKPAKDLHVRITLLEPKAELKG